MKIMIAAASLLMLSACAVHVEGGPDNGHYGNHSKLTLNAGTEKEASISCGGKREPVAYGGEDGEPLVLRCEERRRKN